VTKALACIAAAGLACPLGLRRRPAAVALRAGIRRYLEIEEVGDAAGDPVRASRLAMLDEDDRLERAWWLAHHALTEVRDEWLALGGSLQAPIPAFVAAPDSTVARHAPEGLPLVLGPTGVLQGGRGAVFEALQRALVLLDSGRYPAILVGGLDCLTSAPVLRALVTGNRVLGRANGDGVLPGEGAAFVLVVSTRVLSERQAPARLLGVATARDPHPFAGSTPGRGDGLTRVFRDLEPRFPGRVDEVFSAQPSEGFWGRELSYAYLRNPTLMPEPMTVTTVGAALGDTGAASGALALVLALESMSPTLPHRPPLRGSALVYGSSDDGAVGGCIVIGRS
jgi:3-oxoacyl-[acyl-carrier-protein] synthase I